MSFREALEWLEERGGRWCVRASSAACVVVATIGTLRVEVLARSLDVVSVDSALVDAVTQMACLLCQT